MSVYRIISLIFSGLLLWVTPVTAQTPIIIGSDSAPPLSTVTQTGMLDLLAKEAFSRIGKQVIITPLPSERSLINANSGITGGDLVRIDGISQLYPNLLKVPEKICDFDFVAFSKSADLKLSGWDSLKPFSVGIITGWKILEENVHAKVVTKVENAEQLFHLLMRNRADLIIFSRYEGYGVIKDKKLHGVHVVEPPIESREMFLYLNKTHLKLVPQLAEALRKMKEDGTYSEIKHKSLQPYLP